MLPDSGSTPGEWERHGRLLEEWLRLHPTSITTQVALADYWNDYANEIFRKHVPEESYPGLLARFWNNHAGAFLPKFAPDHSLLSKEERSLYEERKTKAGNAIELAGLLPEKNPSTIASSRNSASRARTNGSNGKNCSTARLPMSRPTGSIIFPRPFI